MENAVSTICTSPQTASAAFILRLPFTWPLPHVLVYVLLLLNGVFDIFWFSPGNLSCITAALLCYHERKITFSYRLNCAAFSKCDPLLWFNLCLVMEVMRSWGQQFHDKTSLHEAEISHHFNLRLFIFWLLLMRLRILLRAIFIFWMINTLVLNSNCTLWIDLYYMKGRLTSKSNEWKWFKQVFWVLISASM
jgi:hypothetical protein